MTSGVVMPRGHLTAETQRRRGLHRDLMLQILANHTPGQLAAGLAVRPYDRTIYKHPRDTFRNQFGFFECRAIRDSLWIEYHQIGLHSLANHPAIPKTQPRSRHRSHLSHGFFKRKPAMLPRKPSQHFCKSAGASRVTRANSAVARDHHPGLLIKGLDVPFGHRAADYARALVPNDQHVSLDWCDPFLSCHNFK